MKAIYISVYIITSIFLFYSCSKLSLNKATTTTEDNSISEYLFNDIYAFVDEEVKATDDSITTNTSNCPTVTVSYIDTTTKQRNIIFDFGGVNNWKHTMSCSHDFTLANVIARSALYQQNKEISF